MSDTSEIDHIGLTKIEKGNVGTNPTLPELYPHSVINTAKKWILSRQFVEELIHYKEVLMNNFGNTTDINRKVTIKEILSFLNGYIYDIVRNNNLRKAGIIPADYNIANYS